MVTLSEFAFLTDFSKLSGRDYEDATADLVRMLADQQSLETLELSTRALIRGTSTKNEVDVWWRFVWEGQERRMAFQCKRRGRPIDQGEVFKFLGVLRDLGNDIQGMMVTHLGYQAGALRVAESYDIGALELRRPLERDWAGRFRDLEVHIELIAGHFRDLRVFDETSCSVTLVREHPLYFVGDVADEFHVLTPGGQRMSLALFLGSHAPPIEDIASPVELSVCCPTGTMLFAPSDEVPQQISRVDASMYVARPSSSIVRKGDDVVRLILRDAIGGDVVTFDRAGRPIQDVSFPFPSSR